MQKGDEGRREACREGKKLVGAVGRTEGGKGMKGGRKVGRAAGRTNQGRAGQIRAKAEKKREANTTRTRHTGKGITEMQIGNEGRKEGGKDGRKARSK